MTGGQMRQGRVTQLIAQDNAIERLFQSVVYVADRQHDRGKRCPDCGTRMVRLRHRFAGCLVLPRDHYADRERAVYPWHCIDCTNSERTVRPRHGRERQWTCWAVADTRDLRAYYRDRLGPDKRAVRTR